MIYLLDTDTCIAVLRGVPKALQAIRRIAPDDIAFSSITRYELHYGALRCHATRQKQDLAKVDRFLDLLHELPFEKSTAKCTAQIRRDLEQIGRPIGPMDLQIAATALDANLILVTGNEQEFNRVTGLRVENWIR